MLPTGIWELLVGEFNPGTGMVAAHLGSDHHKACLKLSAWFKQDAPEWLLVFDDFCKQHAPGLCAPYMPRLEYSQPHILHGQANEEAFVLAEVCQRGAVFHSEEL